MNGRCPISLVAFSFLLLLMVAGCKEAEQSEPLGKYVKTDDSAVFLVTDADYLKNHISVTNSSLEFDSTADTSVTVLDAYFKKGIAVQDVALTMIAEAESATTSGVTLQATDIITKSNYAYVSYNIAGDQFGGAIQVINIKDSEAPIIKQEFVFDDIDVSALYISGNTLYAAAAANPATRTVTSPAVLLVIQIKKQLLEGNIEIVDLPSYTATDVLVKGSYIYATVGAADGGLVKLSKEDPTAFTSSTDFYTLDDARSLAVEGSYLGVLKGTDGAVHYFSTSSLTDDISSVSPLRTVAFANTATIANSKSTIDLLGDISLMALGDGGVKAIVTEGNDDTPLFELPALTGVTGLSDSVTVTNAVSASGDLLFRANGEAGVDAYRLSKDIRSMKSGDSVTTTRIGRISFGELMSANAVYYRKGILYVADGLGGLKIVGVDRKASSTEDEDEDSREKDQDDEDDD